MSRLAGAVLAGGAGRRLGGVDKARLEIDGERLVDRVLRALEAVAAPLVVVRGDRPELTGLTVPQIADALPDAGPLAGLVAALEHHADHAAVAVVAVDTPSPSAAVLQHLAEARGDADVCLPVVAGRAQPLHAVVATAAAGRLRAALGAGERRLLTAFEALDVREVTEGELRSADLGTTFAVDLDDPGDLRRWR